MPTVAIPSPVAAPPVHRELTPEETELADAFTRYKKRTRRPHPSLSELLAIAKKLGWRKDGTCAKCMPDVPNLPTLRDRPARGKREG